MLAETRKSGSAALPWLTSTSYVERLNQNARMDIKRLGQRSNAFSKKLLNLKRHLALWLMDYTFCRIHSTLRMPPAMEAGNWHAFQSYDDALTAALAFEPDRYTICNVCLGSYRSAGGYRGPRG